ncbi:DUF6352 family protein [Antarcticirhabdus aurantiaca]|uniref:DUF6352 family protein n=1 Tax=Antarcticirhabdus aurantiaca TaxID=2606717 RepID=A0ACD4NX68_9HYPH|nr:DUF6352 family protein [Antarcticirhabdus aurantiaca]WAJ31440.1 DUF6352 family protein [Jeongeuplla avenae]
MRDFWVSSGHQLLDRNAEGHLQLTDAFLKAYFARPELVPPEDACAAERALHASLLADPRRRVAAGEIEALADADARENWAVMLTFRDRLVAAPTVEAAYLSLVRGGTGRTPPLFLNQLAQVILRNALDAVDDPLVLRAAELFFRPQRASLHEGALLLADAETIDHAEAAQSRAPLLAMFGGPAVGSLDVLTPENAESYFGRNEAFDTVLSLAGGVTARSGIARAIELWVRHLLGIEVSVEPLARIEDADWAWFVGLDAEATRIGNALWKGRGVEEDDLSRIVGLFALRFRRPDEALPAVGARPVWLFLAVGADGVIRMKPQNLVASLPILDPTARS